jgi:haloalkane dehalogenase
MTTKVEAAAAVKWAAEQHFAQLSYGDVAYVDRGIGPVALFIHGFPLYGFQWRDCVTALADFDRRCIVPDMLAMGRTRVKADRGVGFEDWTCSGKVESFPEMKGKLDDQAEGFYERV